MVEQVKMVSGVASKKLESIIHLRWVDFTIVPTEKPVHKLSINLIVLLSYSSKNLLE